MNPYAFSLLFFSFCTFFVGILILLKRNDRIGWRYLLFSSFVSVWSLGLARMISDEISEDRAYFWGLIAEISAAFIPATWIHFIIAYIGGKINCLKVYFALYAVAVVCAFAGIFYPTFFVISVEPIVGFDYYYRSGPVFHLYTAAFLFAIPYGFVLLLKHLDQTRGVERANLVGFISATMTGYLGGTLTFLPGYGIAFPQYGLFLLPFYPFVMAYFMIRKNLFNDYEIAKAIHRDKLAAIGTIATSINHEIKNPLYIIQGMAESFLHNFRNEDKNLTAVKTESVAVLEKTSAQAKRAMEIMSQLSLFARQKEDSQKTTAESVSLKECFENILPLVRYEMTLEKISLKTHLPEDLPPITANLRQIEEVFFNLLVNACQALKTTGGRVEVRGMYENKNVVLTIRDNGFGIPQKQLKKIFEPFYTTKDEGAGLGLYITKQLVEKNGGKISVESQEGKGTRFRLEFNQ